MKTEVKFVKLNVKPEQKDELEKLAQEEGRHMYKMLEILIKEYNKTKEEV